METDAPQAARFDIFHPVVPMAYVVGALVLCMGFLQPACVGIALVSGLALNAVLRGPRAVGRTLLWQVPVALAVAIVNPIVGASGHTELFRIGAHAVYLEGFWYGLMMASMLMATLAWFSNAAESLGSHDVMSVLGNVLPSVALVVTMALRLVPSFVRRADRIARVQDACTAAVPQGFPGCGVTDAAGGTRVPAAPGTRSRKRSRLVDLARRSGILMAWGMEDSLETADSMRARGWNAGTRRTNYRHRPLRAFDAVALAVVVVLLAVALTCAAHALAAFRPYPLWKVVLPWPWYLPMVAYLCLPLVFLLVERLRWRQ